jgi:PAS domain S-box-containing protein
LPSPIACTKRSGDAKLIVIGLSLSVLFWFLEALLHVFVFNGASLTDHVFRPQSHEVWMRLAVMSMFISFGVYAHWMLAARRRAEEAVTLANGELAQIFETAADGMRVVDKNFTVLRANDTFCSLVGIPKKSVVGRKCHDVFRGDRCGSPGCSLTRVMNEEDRVEYDAEKLRRDGTEIPCIVTATPFRRPDGEIIGIVEDFKDISERRRWEREILESRERLRELACHLQNVREEQRSRIAREVHDELGQALTALKMDTHWLGRNLAGSAPELRDKLKVMSNVIDGTVQSVRRICSELRPGILDDFGLVAAIEWQAEEFSKRTSIPCEISTSASEIPLRQELAIAVFRILQEALTNIARHADATRVEVALREEKGRFEMSVHDDGKGVQAEPFARGKSFGLIGIRERVRDFGGEFCVGQAPAGGTCIRIRIPTVNQETRGDDTDTDRG